MHPDKGGELLLWTAEWKAGRDKARHITVNTAILPDLLIQGSGSATQHHKLDGYLT